jgi:hypothetical protein
LKYKEVKKGVHDWYFGDWAGKETKSVILTNGHAVHPWLAKAFDSIYREYKWILGIFIALLLAFLVYSL